MSHGQPSSRPSELQLAIERGLHSSSALFDELRGLGELTVHSPGDAEAVCQAVEMLAGLPETIDGKQPTAMLISLFESVKKRGSSEFHILAERGISSLARIVHRALDYPTGLDRRDVLLSLEVLAHFGTREGAEAIVRCVRAPLHADSTIWFNILRKFTRRHPQREWLYEQLRDPLPEDMIAVSLLNSARTAFDQGATGLHPFDSPPGIAMLHSWLRGSEWASDVACLAVCTLAYVNSDARDELLALALEHRNVRIQLYAARTAAQLGRDAGLQWLVRACLNPVTSKSARRHLAQIGLAEHAPARVQDADFKARAKFSYWLAERSDSGAPQSVEIHEKRRLYWPPARKRRTVRLLRYEMEIPTGMMDPDRDLGMVGSVTDCLFSKHLISRPPNDALASYCYAELCDQGLITEINQPPDLKRYRHLLSQCPDGVTAVELMAVAILSPRLKYPQKTVALARALHGGEVDRLVLDGPRSRWYFSRDFPTGNSDLLALPIHIGRVLLGLSEEPVRKEFLGRRSYANSAAEVIGAFERMLDEAEFELVGTSDGWGRFHRLSARFEDFTLACDRDCRDLRSSRIVWAFEKMLAVAATTALDTQEEIYSYYTPLGACFSAYVAALVELNRLEDVRKSIHLFQPYWDDPFGDAALGLAAVQCNFDELAESLLSKIPHSTSMWWTHDELEPLAELWCKSGKTTKAARLLQSILRQVGRHATNMEHCWERVDNEAKFQSWRTAYLRLFPERGEAELKRLGIPKSTLPESSQLRPKT